MGNEHSKKKEPSKEQTHPHSENGGVHGLAVNITSSGVDIDVNSETPTQPNGKPAAIDPAVESPQEPEFAVIASAEEPVEVAPERPREEDEQPQDKKVHLFDKLFKKKADLEAKFDADIVHEEEKTKNDETDLSLPDANTQLDPANLKPETLTGPQAPEVATEQPDDANVPAAPIEETNPEESPVMNFFKNLNLTVTVPSLVRQMTPTKTSKKESDGVPKEQKDPQPGPGTTVAQVSDPPPAPKGMSVPPPPPPPEPPKLEVKVELSGKPVKASASREKPKDVLSKFFRTKKADPSKAGTLEATAKPEAAAPVHQDKKSAAKSSFFSFFKAKSGDPKKASPAPAAAAPPTVKSKEEPRAAAKSPEVTVDDKAASATSKAGDGAANSARKTEKRNSIHLFLKHLGQKRHSTDAGVQTEPVVVAEKSK
ncbi:breast carcinoma-amplified sequence 1 isoform X3 [Entelurus aequoreus]|uniref:nucleolar and coiled-body phosphoprotein 1-like isoform X11 n=1 Tax=Entelurus aequoreus TaxID=161455 RepID=UPI002B1DF4F5|nr:nucleolar and coiled-body phosphoprotein 1-like isoform X11 [Entelurus aequoreus]XP_061908547.1 breast carcinoma-amplified sequence 1 isoform X3 [Entelurus aequoreus]